MADNWCTTKTTHTETGIGDEEMSGTLEELNGISVKFRVCPQVSANTVGRVHSTL